MVGRAGLEPAINWLKVNLMPLRSLKQADIWSFQG